MIGICVLNTIQVDEGEQTGPGAGQDKHELFPGGAGSQASQGTMHPASPGLLPPLFPPHTYVASYVRSQSAFLKAG